MSDKWEKIKNPEDHDWVEFQIETMTDNYGLVLLKVWKTIYGNCMSSMTQLDGYRYIKNFAHDDIEKAKEQALVWSRSDLIAPSK